MTEVLLLDADQAEKVRGRSPKDNGRALDPIALKDGRFFLGLEVLEDPAHEDVRPFLAAMARDSLEKLPTYGEHDVVIEESVEVAALSVRRPRSTEMLSTRR